MFVKISFSILLVATYTHRHSTIFKSSLLALPIYATYLERCVLRDRKIRAWPLDNSSRDKTRLNRNKRLLYGAC